MNEENILEEEITTEQEQLTYDDIYNAVYNGYMDAYSEIQIQEAEQQLLNQELEGENEEDSNEEIQEEATTEEQIYNVNVQNFPAYYNANVDLSSVTDAIYEGQISSVDFASSTDTRLYTVTTSSAVGSADAQEVALMLEIRNLILIFMLIWFVVLIIRMIKNTTMKFTKGKGDSI